jgi:hypothetical protein
MTVPTQLTHKFHSFVLIGRTGRFNFLGHDYNGPQGTTIVLDYEDVYAMVKAVGDAAMLEITEKNEVRPRHLTLVKPATRLTASSDPRNGAWSTNPHPAHHPHKQEGS